MIYLIVLGFQPALYKPPHAGSAVVSNSPTCS